MKTETENLRELDDWIAEHVTLWEPSVDGGICWDEKGMPIVSVPHYSTDSAAAMQVLEKCAYKLKDEDNEETVSVGFDEPYFVVEKTNCIPNLRVEAPTLPLAIVRFAKQLFSK